MVRIDFRKARLFDFPDDRQKTCCLKADRLRPGGFGHGAAVLLARLAQSRTHKRTGLHACLDVAPGSAVGNRMRGLTARPPSSYRMRLPKPLQNHRRRFLCATIVGTGSAPPGSTLARAMPSSWRAPRALCAVPETTGSAQRRISGARRRSGPRLPQPKVPSKRPLRQTAFVYAVQEVVFQRIDMRGDVTP